ncbi:Protein of unknown function [Pseudobutyrivibrio sp. OR37]|uniref:DUF2493 domain-containing protein n=1 Tax=Pseudobutyrivibrio sp. OR37 TaxID=1798186 RepID=UPI0008ED3F12|nr:DUF2493 domain-containing protein [Pseudobutyrivibrio sp. OR37]SFH76130.1 Protein of unknown function [Pseudobutyrivibrio sp. OR37]
MLYRIIIAGGRDFNNKVLFSEEVNKIVKELGIDNIEIISGHSSGADSLAELYAKKHNISLKIFPAEWKKYGKAAGPIRNKQMLDYSLEEQSVLIAFWNGRSKGTRNMIERAKNEKTDIRIIHY